MKNVQIILLLAVSLLVTGCGKDDAGPQQGAAAPAAPAASTTTGDPDVAAMPSSDGGTRYVDHTKDEREFRLKASLAGLESLLEDVSDPEQVKAIKKDIAALEAKLGAL